MSTCYCCSCCSLLVLLQLHISYTRHTLAYCLTHHGGSTSSRGAAAAGRGDGRASAAAPALVATYTWPAGWGGHLCRPLLLFGPPQAAPLARSEHRPALAWVSGPMCTARRIERRRRIGPLRTRNASCCTTRAIPAKCQSAPKRTRHGPSRCDGALGLARDVGDPQDRAQAAKMLAFTGASRSTN